MKQVVVPPPEPVKNGGQSKETIIKGVQNFKNPELTISDNIYKIYPSKNTLLQPNYPQITKKPKITF